LFETTQGKVMQDVPLELAASEDKKTLMQSETKTSKRKVLAGLLSHIEACFPRGRRLFIRNNFQMTKI
jgi:hypothetical protein